MAHETNNLTKFLKHRYARIAIVVIIIVSLEITAALVSYFSIKQNDNNRIKDIMVTTNEKIIDIINDRVQTIKYTIERNAVLFSINSIYLSSKNYSHFINFNESTTKDIVETYIFIPKIFNNTFDQFINFCQKYIVSDCTIKKFNESKFPEIEFIPISKNKEVYYPLIFSEPPFNPLSQKIVGFDLSSNNITKIIVDTMLSVPNFTAGFRLRIVTKPEENPYSFGVLLNYPSFIDFDNKTTTRINGISSAVIKIGHLFDDAIKNIDIQIDREDVDMLAFDVTSDGLANNTTYNISLLYKENKDAYRNIWSPNDVNITDVLIYNYNISGRQWLLYFIYSASFKKKQETNLLIIIPSVLAAIAILVNIIIFILYKFINSLKQRAIIEKNRTKIAIHMLGYVNHEIRNPLNVIKGLVEYTLDSLVKIGKTNLPDISDNDDTINTKDDRYVNFDKKTFETIVSDLYTVVGSCNMMEHIVTDILDIQKLDSGKLELNNKNVKINEFIKDLVKTVSQKIDEKQTVILNTIYDKKLILHFDPYRMKQILLNYLTNAIKYTNEGSITIRLEEINDCYRFSVIDTGRGIAEESKSKIFQPFNLTNPEDASRYGGIGLGLHLCKMLANRMEGTVGFESKLGIGSTFWVEFPKKLIQQIIEV